MFSAGHLLWCGISFIFTAAGLTACFRLKPSLNKVLKVCLILGVLSEIVKVFSVTNIVPMVEPVIATQDGASVIDWKPTGEYTPYMALEHLPLEMCSLYLFFMLLGLIIKNKIWKKRLYALMFVTGTIGGILGIVLSTITSDLETMQDFFASARAWQYFLYHSMIVTVSLYIGFGNESGLRFSDMKNAMIGIILLDIPTFYLNSIFSAEVYRNNKPVGVTHRINFFSSYVNPLGLILTEKWQWITYLIVRAVLAVIIITFLFSLLKINGRIQNKKR